MVLGDQGSDLEDVRMLEIQEQGLDFSVWRKAQNCEHFTAA